MILGVKLFKSLILTCLFVLFCEELTYSQKTTILAANKAVLLKNNEEIPGGVVVDKEKDKGKYIIAIKYGYMPQAVEVDQLFAKNIAEFTFTLNPITRPVLNKNQKKIRFSKFVDLNYHAGRKGLLATDLENKDPKFSVAMDTFLYNRGFNVDANAVFRDESKKPELLIGAEVVSYKGSKKDTPGFRCSAAFKWSVYDVSQEKVVFSFLTGGYSNEETKMNESEAFIIAAQDAAQELLNNKDFISLIQLESKNTQ